MPAKRLDSDAVTLRRYDVAGQDSDDVPGLVRHVALCAQDLAELTNSDCAMRLAHMLPPFVADDDEHHVHTAGWAVLDADELMQLQVFLDDLDSEYQAQKRRDVYQYTICPHFLEPTEEIPFRRFNCAGFAIEAYRFAGIELLAIDDDLPRVSLSSLKMAYPDRASTLGNPRMRTFMGLEGPESGSWQVVMAGYVINSLNRTAEEIRKSPYLPKVGDEFFPSMKQSPGG